MKKQRIIAAIFGALGGVLAAAALTVCLTQQGAAPRLARYPQEAEDCARALLTHLNAGDYAGASQYIYGCPALDTAGQWDSDACRTLWDAFAASLDGTPEGRCYAASNGLALDVTVRSLDLSQVLDGMGQAAPALLEEQVARAVNMNQVYDDAHEYREDFIRALLDQAAEDGLTQAAPVARPLTLRLVRDRGQWWVLPDQALLSAVSGGLLGKD